MLFKGGFSIGKTDVVKANRSCNCDVQIRQDHKPVAKLSERAIHDRQEDYYGTDGLQDNYC